MNVEPDTPRIAVRYHQDSMGRYGYRWSCTACPTRFGFHEFERWHRHAWNRSMDAAHEHWAARHYIPEQSP